MRGTAVARLPPAVVGAWLKSSDESLKARCTLMHGFTTYLNWDFGVITTDGIETSVELDQVTVADTKFAGVLVLVKGAMTFVAEVAINNSSFVGQSGPDVCGMCTRRYGNGDARNDPGCHPSIARTSYNPTSPFTPSTGLLGSVFAMKFTPGPDTYPWDGLKGYALIHGITRVSGATFANFDGPTCAAMNTYAIGNHAKEPEAFHPVTMQGVTLNSVAK